MKIRISDVVEYSPVSLSSWKATPGRHRASEGPYFLDAWYIVWLRREPRPIPLEGLLRRCRSARAPRSRFRLELRLSTTTTRTSHPKTISFPSILRCVTGARSISQEGEEFRGSFYGTRNGESERIASRKKGNRLKKFSCRRTTISKLFVCNKLSIIL